MAQVNLLPACIQLLTACRDWCCLPVQVDAWDCQLSCFKCLAIFSFDQAASCSNRALCMLQVKKVEGYGSGSGRTSKKIVIADCGQIS
jgi:hypothetical protein